MKAIWSKVALAFVAGILVASLLFIGAGHFQSDANAESQWEYKTFDKQDDLVDWVNKTPADCNLVVPNEDLALIYSC